MLDNSQRTEPDVGPEKSLTERQAGKRKEVDEPGSEMVAEGSSRKKPKPTESYFLDLMEEQLVLKEQFDLTHPPLHSRCDSATKFFCAYENVMNLASFLRISNPSLDDFRSEMATQQCTTRRLITDNCATSSSTSVTGADPFDNSDFAYIYNMMQVYGKSLDAVTRSLNNL
ncbi:hypothetical protein DXG01_011452, partial [Tephrocybe rancida]